MLCHCRARRAASQVKASVWYQVAEFALGSGLARIEIGDATPQRQSESLVSNAALRRCGGRRAIRAGDQDGFNAAVAGLRQKQTVGTNRRRLAGTQWFGADAEEGEILAGGDELR
jgi:hypothetical protein